jgi:ferric iron reductase protein FhuF
MGSRNEVAAGPALAAAAAVGPFFAWDELSPAPADGWRPLADLADPDVLAGRVTVTRAALVARSGPVPERVAASVLSLGMLSRLVSPPLAAVAVAEVLPVPRADRMWWRAAASGPLPVGWSAIAAVDTRDMDDAAVAAAFTDGVVDGLVAPVLAAFRRRFRLSPKVLAGNVASALGGAVTMLTGAHPDRADRAGRVLARILDRAPLAGAATVCRSASPPARWVLERHNCCLYYRIPGGGLCGDCVLRHRKTVGGSR